MAASKKSRSQSSEEPLVCPSCARPHGADERFCANCGMPLVYADEKQEPMSPEREHARKIDPRYAQGEPVKVAFAGNQAQSDLVQNMLLEEGVPSITRRTRGFDVPDFLAAGPRDILVPESGAEYARAFLRDADVVETVSAPTAATTARFQARVVLAVLGGGLIASFIAWLAVHAGS